MSAAAGLSTPRSIAKPKASVTGLRFGRYEALVLLASGGMGRVLIARLRTDASVRRLVAIKTIHAHLLEDETFTRLFEREAQIAAKLFHPNVVPVLELGRSDDNGLFLVMEYFPSRSLSAVVRSAIALERAVPHGVAAAMIADVAGALHAAHELEDEQGVPLELVHRDVTPSNILVGVDGAVKLTDFGVVKVRGSEFPTLTQSADEIRGKLGYLSPEQLSGARLDRRSDVFTLGICLWELLARRRLYPRRDSDAAMLSAVMHGAIADVREVRPDVPEALALVVARALARDRDERYPTALALREALLRCTGADTEPQRRALMHALCADAIESERSEVAQAEAALMIEATTEPSLHAVPAAEAAASVAPTRAPRRLDRVLVAMLLLLGASAIATAVWVVRSPRMRRDHAESPATTPRPVERDAAALAPTTTMVDAAVTTSDARASVDAAARRTRPRPRPSGRLEL